ncbi:DEAD-box like helicase [Phaffia rhodozyma]|uniref:ATP-dependent DNA helicase n=1 Tax=Phaffia rhodozyma TaxID=264483 RepID=A0A0F7SK13_PHARH|nr:DEAD-box like helicase [Phaffia rhodozyma]
MASSDTDEFDSFALDEADLRRIDALSKVPSDSQISAQSHHSLSRPSRPPPPPMVQTRFSYTAKTITHISPSAKYNQPRPPPLRPPAPIPSSSHQYSDEFAMDITPESLQEIDHAIATGVGTASRLRQMNLFGERAQVDEFDVGSSQGLVRKVGKVWDRAEWEKKVAMRKKTGKPWDQEEEEGEEEEEAETGFDQFPAPVVPLGDLPPLKHAFDAEAGKTWIYPINLPLRSYQLNIVRKSLFTNTLVALPTGLGKTFVAGVVMLNYNRWFPTGKIFFIAPTKPLVNQQAQAFPETCGFLNSKVAVLMGDTNKDVRQQTYPEKSVFFMTAQTMMNDLQNGRLDPREVILLVVDEAHKATSNHSYCQVVRFLQSRNHNFRILALTATPSGKVEGVQSLIDNLHLSHIEIRDEESLDLKAYVHKKNTELVLVPMTPNVIKLKDMLSEIMQPMINQLIKGGIFKEYESDPTRLHAFRAHAARTQCMRQKNFKYQQVLTKLESYARAMGYLLEHSISMFQRTIADKIPKKDTPASNSKELRAIGAAIEEMKVEGGYVPHAKMDRLKSLLLDHFAPREPGDGKGDLNPDTTRVMVFCMYRDCVEEIVTMLNKESPLLRAVPFVGQATDKSGRKGLKQAEQIQVIKDFKCGKINVLVATSIGEEGLDIGSVDKIICYDAQKSSVRMLQRIGRTGRKREGSIYVLMGEGREESSWDKAKESYESVQMAITKGAILELYDDVPRILPPECKPQLVQKVVPIDDGPPVVQDTKPRRASKIKQTKTSKETAGAARRGAAIPTGASLGFVNARALTSGSNKKKNVEVDPMGIDSDSDDLAIEMGPAFSTFSRSVSENEVKLRGAINMKGKGKERDRVRGVDETRTFKRSRTLDDPFVGKRSIGTRPAPRTDSEEAAAAAAAAAVGTTAALMAVSIVPEGEEDEDEEKEVIVIPSSTPSPVQPKGKGRDRQPPARHGHSPSPTSRAATPTELDGVSLPKDVAAQAGFDKIDPAWVLDDSFDQFEDSSVFSPGLVTAAASKLDTFHSDSRRGLASTSRYTTLNTRTPVRSTAPQTPIIRSTALVSSIPQQIDQSWILADDDEDHFELQNQFEIGTGFKPSSELRTVNPTPESQARKMLPPMSTRPLSSPFVGSPFESTQAVRRPGARPRVRAVAASSSPVAPSPLKRVRATRPAEKEEEEDEEEEDDDMSSFIERRQQRKKKPKKMSVKGPSWYRGVVPDEMKRFYDRTAGDERDDDAILSDDGSAIMDEETEEDRAFAGDFQATQVPKGYNQQAAYLTGLRSPSQDDNGKGPRFTTTRADAVKPFKRYSRPSSEDERDGRQSGSEEDDYYLEDSFCAGDDETIEYDESSELF